jgi:endo-1,4-beta-xylanase
MKKLLGFSAVIMLVLSGCSEPDAVAPQIQLKGYEQGTHNGWFWSKWTDDRSGYVNLTLGSGGNYAVAWNYQGNFTTGKGWSTGSRTRRIGYNCGAYTCNGGGVFAYYGWTRNPLIEYYVNEKWGSGRPTGERRGSVSSDGGQYDIYTAMRYNAPSIDGTRTFRQVFSTRTSQAPTGQNRVITFQNHANAWSNVGLGLGTDFSPAAILLTEGYGGSNGYVNATVWNN